MLATDHAAVRAQLARILGSPEFAKSPRMSRSLRFVVEKTLDGGAERIKEYVIAIEVFEKPASYKPQVDSTVRTEATKLRSRLTRYYETDGGGDAVLITIPKGAYVPKFEQTSVRHSPPNLRRTRCLEQQMSPFTDILHSGRLWLLR